MNICICDDNEICLDIVTAMIKEYQQSENLEQVTIYRNHTPEKLLDNLNKRKIDVYLLDIIYENTGKISNGIELARAIREKIPYAQIIFMSSSTEYIQDCLAMHPIQYLIKPIDTNALFDALDFANTRISHRQSQFYDFHSASYGVTPTSYNDIVYIHRQYDRFYLCNRKGQIEDSIYLRGTLMKAAGILLKDQRFVSPHVSYIINMDYVDHFTHKSITLKAGTQIPISRQRREQTLDHLKQYLGRE